MPTVEITRDVEISIRVSREQRTTLLAAAELEADGDMAGFITDVALKAARKALATDETRTHILRIGGK